MVNIDEQTQIELEAAAFRKLTAHLLKRNDVQNIDIMNLAGFCRNCLSKWYLAAAEQKGLDMTMDDARESVYGMTYDNWKSNYQRESTTEQQEAFSKVMAEPNLTS